MGVVMQMKSPGRGIRKEAGPPTGSGHANRGFLRGVVLAQKAGLEAEPHRARLLVGVAMQMKSTRAWLHERGGAVVGGAVKKTSQRTSRGVVLRRRRG